MSDKTQSKNAGKYNQIFDKEDLIPCRSITFGELLMVGAKTKFVYKWADYDDVQEVEYQDLIYDVKIPGGSYSRFPRFIVIDDDCDIVHKLKDQNDDIIILKDTVFVD